VAHFAGLGLRLLKTGTRVTVLLTKSHPLALAEPEAWPRWLQGYFSFPSSWICNIALKDLYVPRPVGRFGRLKLRQVRYFETSGSDYVLMQRRDVSYVAEKTSKLVDKDSLSVAAQR